MGWNIIIKIPFIILLSTLCLLSAHLIWHFSENFHARDFAHGFDPSFSTSVESLDPTVLAPYISQTFTYLGHGKQMVAFESTDKQVVIKFFNPMRPLKPLWYKQLKLWIHYCTLKWITRERLHKKARLKKLFNRHKIAYEKIREETGLLYVHLSPSEKISQTLLLLDQKGRLHKVNLANTPFVLQTKAELAFQRFQRLLQTGNREEIERHIHELRTLFTKRAEAGITDRIQTLSNNYGFVGKHHAIQIDVGRIRYKEEIKLHPAEECERIFKSLQGVFNQWSLNYEAKDSALVNQIKAKNS